MNERLIEIDVGGFDRQAPAARHRVARVEDQVHQDLLQLSGVGADGVEPGRQLRHQFDAFADQPAEHLAHPDDQCVEIDRRRMEHLFAAERQQLPGQGGRALARLDHFDHVGAARIVRGERVDDEVREAEDRGQQIVEVVGDAAGELADGLHFLRLTELRFEGLPLADVDADAEEPNGGAQRVVEHPTASGQPMDAAVGPDGPAFRVTGVLARVASAMDSTTI